MTGIGLFGIALEVATTLMCKRCAAPYFTDVRFAAERRACFRGALAMKILEHRTLNAVMLKPFEPVPLYAQIEALMA